jgi:hypothetical protein
MNQAGARVSNHSGDTGYVGKTASIGLGVSKETNVITVKTEKDIVAGAETDPAPRVDEPDQIIPEEDVPKPDTIDPENPDISNKPAPEPPKPKPSKLK